MKLANLTSQKPSRPEGDFEVWWAKVAHDVTGVDRDIEAVLGLLQRQHGCTREMASAELVRRLSFVP